MKVIFLPSSSEDVRWFTRYYRFSFPAGRRNARERMARTLASLSDNPRLGYAVPETNHREFPISRTPFSLIYRIVDDRIEIMRLLDGRANRD
jgi:plasmid stabilization system protein ParE